MNRRPQWTLAALALALAAGIAPAQTGPMSSSSSTASCSGTARAVTWEFAATREGGAALLQMQAGPGATATCESITLRVGGTPVTLTTDGQKVRVRSGPAAGGRRIEASAERVALDGQTLALAGTAQVRFERDGQHPQIVSGDRVMLNLTTGDFRSVGKVDLSAPVSPTAISLDFGFPVVVPAAENEKNQTFDFILGFSR
jgi:hypothetical protein